jgi:hypothetical protein
VTGWQTACCTAEFWLPISPGLRPQRVINRNTWVKHFSSALPAEGGLPGRLPRRPGTPPSPPAVVRNIQLGQAPIDGARQRSDRVSARVRRPWAVPDVDTNARALALVAAFEGGLVLLRGFGVQPTPHSGPTALPNEPSPGHYVGRASTWPWIRNRRQPSRIVERGSSGEVLFVFIDHPPPTIDYAGLG